MSDLATDDAAVIKGLDSDPNGGGGGTPTGDPTPITDGAGGAEDGADAGTEGGDSGAIVTPFDRETLFEDIDGVPHVNLHLLPEEYRLSLGADEADRLSFEDAKWRRSEVDRAVSKASEWKQERDQHYLPDGTSKGQLLDTYNQRMESEPAKFLTELAANVPNPVAFAWEVLKTHAPEMAQVLHPHFQSLPQHGYNPDTFQVKALQGQVQRLEDTNTEAAKEQRIQQGRAEAKTRLNSLAGKSVTESEYNDVEKLWHMAVVHWDAGLLEGERPTIDTAYSQYVEQQSNIKNKPPVLVGSKSDTGNTAKPPRRGGQGSGGDNELTSKQIAKEIVDKNNARRNRRSA